MSEASSGWLHELVQKHDNDLYRGNGRPGIVERVGKCEDGIKEVRDDVNSINRNFRTAFYLLGTLIAAVLAEIVIRLLK